MTSSTLLGLLGSGGLRSHQPVHQEPHGHSLPGLWKLFFFPASLKFLPPSRVCSTDSGVPRESDGLLFKASLGVCSVLRWFGTGRGSGICCWGSHRVFTRKLGVGFTETSLSPTHTWTIPFWFSELSFRFFFKFWAVFFFLPHYRNEVAAGSRCR